MPAIFRRKLRYVLKGRNPKGVWEELGEYDKKVNVTDVLDVIEEYREKGYDYFRLDVYTEDGKYVRREWSRKYAPRRAEDSVEKALDVLSKMEEIKEKLKKALGVKEMDPLDVLATLMYYEELKKKAVELLAPTIRSSGSELGEIVSFLKTLTELKTMLPTAPPQMPTTATTTFMPLPATQHAVEEKAGEIESEILAKVQEKLKPPCAEEKCTEVSTG